MTKQEILEYFKDINAMYNNPNMLDSLEHMIDKLLKAQEPKVMTLEDASKRDVCWLEWRRRGRKPVACRVIIRGNRIGDKVLWVYRFFEEPSVYSMSKYGKEWRCWTSRPTDEQREAVKWA